MKDNITVLEYEGKKITDRNGSLVPGIEKEIFKQQDIDKITSIPSPSKVTKVVAWAIPILIIALIVYGFITNLEIGLKQLQSWVLWNSCMAAVFTAIALGHLLSILTSFVLAPIIMSR